MVMGGKRSKRRMVRGGEGRGVMSGGVTVEWSRA